MGIINPSFQLQSELKRNPTINVKIPKNSGNIKFFGGFLLWDSIKSKIYFFDKLWPDIKIDDLNTIIQKIFK